MCGGNRAAAAVAYTSDVCATTAERILFWPLCASKSCT